MVRHAGEYPWSSYALNRCGHTGWLTPRDEYLQLGSEPVERARAYRALFAGQLGQEILDLIRQASHYNQPVGDAQFRDHIKDRYGIELGQMRRGRPARVKTD